MCSLVYTRHIIGAVCVPLCIPVTYNRSSVCSLVSVWGGCSLVYTRNLIGAMCVPFGVCGAGVPL